MGPPEGGLIQYLTGCLRLPTAIFVEEPGLVDEVPHDLGGVRGGEVLPLECLQLLHHQLLAGQVQLNSPVEVGTLL